MTLPRSASGPIWTGLQVRLGRDRAGSCGRARPRARPFHGLSLSYVLEAIERLPTGYRFTSSVAENLASLRRREEHAVYIFRDRQGYGAIISRTTVWLDRVGLSTCDYPIRPTRTAVAFFGRWPSEQDRSVMDALIKSQNFGMSRRKILSEREAGRSGRHPQHRDTVHRSVDAGVEHSKQRIARELDIGYAMEYRFQDLERGAGFA